MTDFSNRCFVCKNEIDPLNTRKNSQINLPVRDECSGTVQEKKRLMSCWREWLTVSFADVSKKGHRAHIEPLAIIPIGFANSETPTKSRKALSEIVHREKFTNL